LLMHYGANARATANDGANAAVAAAVNGHAPALQYFIEDIKLPVDSSTTDGMSALQNAAKRGHVRVVRYLIDQGADPHALTPNGQDIIMLAAANGRLELLRYFIGKLGIPASPATDRDGLTALHLAATEGHLRVVEYLLEQGTVAGLKSDDGQDAATIAARSGHLKVVEFLMRRTRESDTGAKAMSPADFMALVQSTPPLPPSPLRTANQSVPQIREQRLFDAMLVEIQARRPVTAGRFNAYLARALDDLWPTAQGLTQFLKAIEVLLVSLEALDPQDRGRGRTRALTATACARLVIAEFDRYAISLIRQRSRLQAQWQGFSAFRSHVESHLKALTITRAFFSILEAANYADSIGLKEILQVEMEWTRWKLHRSPNHETLIAEYRAARLAATGTQPGQ
jgi:hypothetical protein